MLFTTKKDGIPESVSEDNLKRIVELTDEWGAILVLAGGSTLYPLKVYVADEVKGVEVIVSEAASGDVIFDSKE